MTVCPSGQGDGPEIAGCLAATLCFLGERERERRKGSGAIASVMAPVVQRQHTSLPCFHLPSQLKHFSAAGARTPSAPALPFLILLFSMRSDQLSYETSCWPLQLFGGSVWPTKRTMNLFLIAGE